MRIVSQNGCLDINYDNTDLYYMEHPAGHSVRFNTKMNDGFGETVVLQIGIYSSKEKALNVMEMIRVKFEKSHYVDIDITDMYVGDGFTQPIGDIMSNIYFDMPQDEDVGIVEPKEAVTIVNSDLAKILDVKFNTYIQLNRLAGNCIVNEKGFTYLADPKISHTVLHDILIGDLKIIRNEVE